MSDYDENADIPAALAAGTALARPFDLAPTPGAAVAVVVPDGYQLHTEDGEKYAPHPFRAQGCVKPQDLDSLIAYTAAHSTKGTQVFVDARELLVTAVLDGHAATTDLDALPGWGQHRAQLRLRYTPEWEAWLSHDNDLMDQVTFAEFVEDNQKDVRDPDSATLMEIASTFSSKTDATFKSAHSLSNGSLSVEYHENVTAQAGVAGNVEIPKTFTLALAVFEGGPKYEVTARLRHRTSGGHLRLGFKLERLADVLRYAFQGDKDDGVVPRLRAGLPAAQVYVGSPS